MNYYILYRIEDRTVLSFIAEDIYDQYEPAEGHAITINYLEYGDEIPYLNEVFVDENNIGIQIANTA